MKPKTMILMALAIVCGLGASYMTAQVLAERTTAEPDKVKILVAKKTLNIGDRFVKPEDYFEEKLILKEDDKDDAIRDLDALKNKILKMARNKGDCVTAANLLGMNDQLPIPEGHQAVGLRVNMETSASGLATLPHSRVDIHVTRRGQAREEARTDAILQNVLVLAADGKVDRDGLTAVAQVVTLALRFQDVQKVNLAREIGTISLSLRNLGDSTESATTGITEKQLFGKSNKEPEVAASPIEEKKAPPAEVKQPVQETVKQVAPKTIKREYTIIRDSHVEHIVREVTEDGEIVSETRRVTPLGGAASNNGTGTNPAGSRKTGEF